MFKAQRTDGPPLTAITLQILAAADYGTLVPYTVLMEAVGGDSVKQVQDFVQRVKRRLEQQHRKAVEAVPNEGYRVVKPSEHLRLARGQQSRSRRALARAQSTVTHVDTGKLTEGERAAVTMAATALAAQITYMRQNDIRVGRLEKTAELLITEQERSAQETAELRSRLERLEAQNTRPEEM